MKQKALQFIRGGQIFDYTMKQWFQVSGRIVNLAIIGYVLLVILLMLLVAHTQLKLLAMYAYATVLELMGQGNEIVWQTAPHHGLTATAMVHSMAIHQLVLSAKAYVIRQAIWVLALGGLLYAGIVRQFTRYFVRKGEKYSQDKYISGTCLAIKPQEVIASVKKSKEGSSDIRLLSLIPLPHMAERMGIFFHGSTGSGKTQAIMRLLDDIRALGEPAIIYDKECTLKPFFFDINKDIELNPLSILCPNWDLWEECANPLELGTLAAYLMPKSIQGSDPFWVDSARTIFTSVAWRMRHQTNRDAISLLRILLTGTLDEMRAILEGTEAENLVHKEIEKTAISIKSVLATYTKSLRFLAGLEKSPEKFSIKKWVKDAMESNGKSKGWLFITSRAQYHKEMKPLISLWLGLAMQSIQSLTPNSPKRIWLIMDELASLHRLEMLSDTLADIRKFGGCVAIGIQSIAQLEFLYGQYEAHAIADLLNTSVYFRSPKTKIAKWVSQELGEQIIEEVRESQSYGPNSLRDGNTISHQRVKRDTVEAATIKTLKTMECFVQLIGEHPIARHQMSYLERPIRIEPLKERTIDYDAIEKMNHMAQAAIYNPEVDKAVKHIQQFEEAAHVMGEHGDALEEKSQHEAKDIEEREAPLQYAETRF